MPRDINNNTITQKNREQNAPIVLYEINVTGDTWLYLAEYDEDVVFDGQTYTSFPLTSESISENAGGVIDSVVIRAANVNREMQVYIENNDAFRGQKVVVKLVWADYLDDPNAYVEDEFFVDKVVADENVVEFTLTSKFDVLDIELPLRKYNRHFCSWVFKSSECGYSGLETVCNHTLTRCKELGNVRRYGSFPSIPEKVYYGS